MRHKKTKAGINTSKFRLDELSKENDETELQRETKVSKKELKSEVSDETIGRSVQTEEYIMKNLKSVRKKAKKGKIK